jgi:hypothetical protein
MESHIEAIRTAMQPEAADSAKQEGIRACRAILATLATLEEGAAKPQATAEASSGTSTEAAGAGASSPAPAKPAPNPSGGPNLNPASLPEISALLGSLRGMPAEQLLDLAIARLRAALPPGSTVPAAAPVRFQLIPLHNIRDAK